MYNIFVSCFGHETNTFTPDITSLDRFGGTDIADADGSRLYNKSFTDVLNTRDDVNVISGVAAWACPYGKVDAAAYEYISDKLLLALRSGPSPDGVLLSLHGAMVTTASEDGEGDLLEQVRAVVGPDVPVGVLVDLHANITEKMLKNASWIINYDTYPHIDIFERGAECARLMLDTLDGKVKPVMAAVKLPLILEFVPTTKKPASDLLKAVYELEKDSRILSASVSYGFFCADIYESGAAVTVIADGNMTTARKSAEYLADKLWAMRAGLKRHFIGVEDAIAAVKSEKDVYPVVFADCCDNPGGGASGDATHILHSLLDSGIKHAVIACIYDPETVEKACSVGVGNMGDFVIGSKFFPEITGAPVCRRAYVRSISDGHFDLGMEPDLNIMGDGNLDRRITYPPVISQHGKVAALDLDGVIVLVSSVHAQTWNDYAIRACGIQPEKQQLIAVKSTVHFRHCFEKYAAKIYEIWTRGLSEQLIDHAAICNSRRPVYPLDDI